MRLQDGRTREEGGVVHEDVDAAEFEAGGLDARAQVIVFEDVHLDGKGPAAQRLNCRRRFADRARQVVGRFEAASADDDVAAFARELQRYRLADAAGAAGDQGYLTRRVRVPFSAPSRCLTSCLLEVVRCERVLP